jgi:hypothetical protein
MPKVVQYKVAITTAKRKGNTHDSLELTTWIMPSVVCRADV